MLEAGEAASWSPVVAEATLEGGRSGGTSVLLVGRARDGDADAFDAIARHHIDRCYRLAFAILRSEVDAADAVQEAFVAAWRRLPSLRDPAAFQPWLDRIVVNACRMSLRHRRVVRLREVHVAEPADHESRAVADRSVPGPEDGVADAELVRRALERLDSDKRAILVLHHVEDRPVGEIAAVLGVPVGTIKWRLHSAREALAQALEEVAR